MYNQYYDHWYFFLKTTFLKKFQVMKVYIIQIQFLTARYMSPPPLTCFRKVALPRGHVTLTAIQPRGIIEHSTRSYTRYQELLVNSWMESVILASFVESIIAS